MKNEISDTVIYLHLITPNNLLQSPNNSCRSAFTCKRRNLVQDSLAGGRDGLHRQLACHPLLTEYFLELLIHIQAGAHRVDQVSVLAIDKEGQPVHERIFAKRSDELRSRDYVLIEVVAQVDGTSLQHSGGASKGPE